MKDTSETVEITELPFNALALGWLNAKIVKASDGFTLTGNPKHMLTLVVTDGPAIGRTIFGHISLADYPNAIDILQSLKQSIGISASEPLPEMDKLIGKMVRVYVTEWKGMESVSGFALPEIKPGNGETLGKQT